MARKRGRKPKPASQRKRSTTLFIDPRQRTALQRLATQLGVSMGHLIREGINLVLARHNADRRSPQ